jgi:flavin reductase (DIM6/NTAB) family NADH-FMN oxidoreductase RutF
MRSWPSGVTVVATRAKGRLEGCTVSAFTSVAVDPPLVLVCLDQRGRTCAAAIEAGRFSVNVLRSDQAWIAERFSQKGARDRFAGVGHRLELGVPLLVEAVCHLVCDVADVMQGGDHVVILGAPTSGAFALGGDPLLYLDRTFRQPGESVPARAYDSVVRRYATMTGGP